MLCKAKENNFNWLSAQNFNAFLSFLIKSILNDYQLQLKPEWFIFSESDLNIFSHRNNLFWNSLFISNLICIYVCIQFHFCFVCFLICQKPFPLTSVLNGNIYHKTCTNICTHIKPKFSQIVLILWYSGTVETSGRT